MQPQPLRPITSQTQSFDLSNQLHDDLPNGKRQRSNMTYPTYPMSMAPYSMPMNSSAAYSPPQYATTQTYGTTQQQYPSSNQVYASNQHFGYTGGNYLARYGGSQYQGNQAQYNGTNSATPPTQYSYDGGAAFPASGQYPASATASYMSQQQTPATYATQGAQGQYQTAQTSMPYTTVPSPFGQQAQQPRLPPIHQVPVGANQALQYAEA